ncbi:MAG: LysM peptidoglycan-binding domain-containing protein [Anaerolineales bacterium]|nr:LysM peptidoglycan-binding domain-containing protein [Anaerolineales bacterium]
MQQIQKTVDQFLGSIVGVGLICFASFILLLASAQLNQSRLGDLLAGLAGETARTARTESFAYWGRVGGEVASGLGYGQPLSTGGGSAVVITPVVIVATQAPSNSTPAPQATARPSAYIRSSPLSEGGLLLWRGLDAAGQTLPLGVSLQNVQNQVRTALQQNSGDLLALWLQSKLKTCEPLYNQMVQANYQDVARAAEIRTAADALINQCNSRLYEAYARKRWASITQWLSVIPVDTTQASALLGGLRITIGNKIDGPARQIREQDNVEVSIQSFTEFGLSGVTFRLPAIVINQLLGVDAWQLNSGPYTVPGTLFPSTTAEPTLPTEADLTPPSGQVSTTTGSIVDGAQSKPASGTYVVQSGDTLYKIARTFGVSPQDLIAANQNVVGFNPDFIQVGMELRIP